MRQSGILRCWNGFGFRVEQRFSAALELCYDAASAAEVPQGLKPSAPADVVCRPEGLLHPEKPPLATLSQLRVRDARRTT